MPSATSWASLALTVRTPMFLGVPGEPLANSTVLFPIPSLRGALRYWLRALVGAHLPPDETGLPVLAAVERAVFGVAGTDETRTRAQSTVALRARRPVAFVPTGPKAIWMDDDGHVAYLLGQGLWARDRTLREWRLTGHIPPDTMIPLAVRLDPRAPHRDACADLLTCALWALTAFGGLGARARRGFGTVEVTSFPGQPSSALPWKKFDPDWMTPTSVGALPDVLGVVRASLTLLGVNIEESPADHQEDAPPPAYPCLRPGWYQTADWELHGRRHSDYDLALSELGVQLREFRTNGPDNPRTQEYEDLVRPWLNQQQVPDEPFTIGALGLPVVYMRKSDNRTAVVAPRAGNGEELRRASPLWLRAYPATSGAWRLRSLALISEFLPPDAHLEIRGQGQAPEPLTSPNVTQFDNLLRAWFT